MPGHVNYIHIPAQCHVSEIWIHSWKLLKSFQPVTGQKEARPVMEVSGQANWWSISSVEISESTRSLGLQYFLFIVYNIYEWHDQKMVDLS